ncbi:MAG: nucleotidyltransferase domain-containing protein [Ktedonobacteraceae bacterium]|jgi:predicted nucleotidyltransferase
MELVVDERIVNEALRIATQSGVLAVLLAGSYAQGQSWPHSDVDLLVIIEQGPTRIDVADVDWTTFDTRYTMIEELEKDIATSFITCNAMLDLVTLVGDPAREQRIETRARQLYPHHVLNVEALQEMRVQLRAETEKLRVAYRAGDRVAQAHAGGNIVWLAGRICLSLSGIGPVREDQWHDLLRTAPLPFNAATPLARWHIGTGIDERLEAAFTLAEQALGAPLPRTRIDDVPLPRSPTFEKRSLPDAAEAVEMHRLIQAVGFGKMAKALWKRDKIRQASEAGVIVWFSVPACLALGGIVAPEPQWWHEALSHLTLPFEAATLYTHTLIGETFEERKTAACELGRSTLDVLETAFRNTPSEHKYHRG